MENENEEYMIIDTPDGITGVTAKEMTKRNENKPWTEEEREQRLSEIRAMIRKYMK